MRIVINIVLVAIIVFLIYLLVNSINEPIAFQKELSTRREAVVAKLKVIRDLQSAYRGITDTFASNFTDLKYVLSNDSFKLVSIYGDPDKGEEIRREVSYVPAKDSMARLGINIDSIDIVPFAEAPNNTFEIEAGTIEYQSTQVSVLEVRVPYKNFMGPFADARYKRYDRSYNPDDAAEPNYYLKFGDLSKPTTSGNWE